jgi:hypothetical protein
MRTLQATLLTIFVHSFVGWLYIAGNAIAHPETLPLPLTHLAPWPREDTFGIACFALSIVSFFAWNMVRYRTR